MKKYSLNKTKYNRLEISKILNVSQLEVRSFLHRYGNLIPPIWHNNVPYYTQEQIDQLEQVIRWARVGKNEKDIKERLTKLILGDSKNDIINKLKEWEMVGIISKKQTDMIMMHEKLYNNN